MTRGRFDCVKRPAPAFAKRAEFNDCNRTSEMGAGGRVISFHQRAGFVVQGAMPRFALWSGALALCFVCACGGEETEKSSEGSGASGSGASDPGSGGGQTTGQGGATTSGAGGAGGSGCMPKVTDSSNIDAVCDKDEDCLTGYVCQEFIGFMVTHTCQILCAETCECPTGTSCIETSDKQKTWMQCTVL
jgi:hypothetical protein